MRWMSDFSEKVGESEQQCLLTSLSVLSGNQRNDLNVKQDIALKVIMAIIGLPTNPKNNSLKLQSTVFLRNWHVALSLCLRGQYVASATLARAAIESLSRIIYQGETDVAAKAWFNDERVCFTELLRAVDTSGDLLAWWRDLSEFAHGKTAAGAAVVGPGVLFLGAQFDPSLFWKLTGILDSVLVCFLRFTREGLARGLVLEQDTERLLNQL